jgi:hypothetical protein
MAKNLFDVRSHDCEKLRALITERTRDAEGSNPIPFDKELRKQIRRRGMKRLAKISRKGNLKRTRGSD